MRENTSIQSIKVWIFPTLLSILAMMIWNDVNEIKADVKALMAQSNVDKTRIDNLERALYKSSSFPTPVLPKEHAMLTRYAILPNKDTYKKQKYEKILL